MSWREAAETPLCLLTPDMQNRRILNAHFREVGAVPRPSVETNSVITLCSHLRTGHWSSVLPQAFFRLFGDPSGLRAIPLVDPDVSHGVGLVVPDREPLTPSARHLVDLVGRPDVMSEVAAGDGRGLIRPAYHPIETANLNAGPRQAIIPDRSFACAFPGGFPWP